MHMDKSVLLSVEDSEVWRDRYACTLPIFFGKIYKIMPFKIIVMALYRDLEAMQDKL